MSFAAWIFFRLAPFRDLKKNTLILIQEEVCRLTEHDVEVVFGGRVWFRRGQSSEGRIVQSVQPRLLLTPPLLLAVVRVLVVSPHGPPHPATVAAPALASASAGAVTSNLPLPLP